MALFLGALTLYQASGAADNLLVAKLDPVPLLVLPNLQMPVMDGFAF